MKKNLFLWNVCLVVFALVIIPAYMASAANTSPALAKVIEGAKKEGTVLWSDRPQMGENAKMISLVREGIKRKFGVDLDIKCIGESGMPKKLAKMIMEHRTGTPPSYDLILFNDGNMAKAISAGTVEPVDWKPLLTKDMSQEVIMSHPLTNGGLSSMTNLIGLMYNPKKVSADEVPKNLKQMSDPKWKGKVGILFFGSVWTRWCKILGKDKVLNDIKAMMKNGAISGTFQTLYNRYLLGEISIVFIGDTYIVPARRKGMPVAWQPLDFAALEDFGYVIVKGARHPNAAKLVALFMCSPEGVRMLYEYTGAGNYYYPDNIETELASIAKKQGVPIYRMITYPGMMEYVISDESKKLEKQITLTIRKGGR